MHTYPEVADTSPGIDVVFCAIGCSANPAWGSEG